MPSSLAVTEACGMAFYECDSCAEPRQFYRSCGNRHCPTCQHNKTQQWLQMRRQTGQVESYIIILLRYSDTVVRRYANYYSLGHCALKQYRGLLLLRHCKETVDTRSDRGNVHEFILVLGA
jgi:Transposase zinc-binding domain